MTLKRLLLLLAQNCPSEVHTDNPKVKFHTLTRRNLELLSIYCGPDSKSIHIDIGEDGE